MNKMKSIATQVFKFGLVGGLAFLIDIFILYILIEIFSLYYLFSTAIAFSMSVIFNYILSIKWVFDVSKSIGKQMQLFIFIILSLIGLGINQIVMYMCVEKFNVFYMNAKIISTIIVMLWNYISKKMSLED